MNILMMEGNTIEKQQAARKLKIRTTAEIYSEAVRLFVPEAEIDVVNAADGEVLPKGKSFEEYCGMIVSGSSLRAFDDSPEVKSQLDLLAKFGETGLPVLGSCWGMQIAAVVAGGKVGPSKNGREIGVARKVRLTEAGAAHPFFKGKPLVFDAPCIHYDEITQFPENATLLCTNGHSEVQGAVIPVGKSEVWGIQYHPEFDLAQIRMLYQFYKEDLLEQGFVNSEAEYDALMYNILSLESNPNNKALCWQMGIDSDILQDNIRALEIKNWLDHIAC